MAYFEIETTAEEQQKVFEAVKKIEGKTVSVTAIAKLAAMNPNRVRFCLVDLEDQGRIERIATKAFNEHYIRYTYKITEVQ